MADFDLPRMQSLSPEQEHSPIAYDHRPMATQHQVMFLSCTERFPLW
uniref:Uncharacterized protein n=1 Tax=Anopheles dirus TaxID=7168 RepID=A0A182NY84_9DIPT